ncbi:MAG: MATE family efflux transporter [Phocaeicola plebeius]|nr:MATE family efflux transporter [Phocaeicola plebeius]
MSEVEEQLARIRGGQILTWRQQLALTVRLSLPSVIAQFSSIVMQYIDASMVGSLGAAASASIGLVSTTAWLFSGLCASWAAGFYVQVAHRLGAKDSEGARDVFRQSLVLVPLFGIFLLMFGTCLSRYLPGWLGGAPEILPTSSSYFFIYACSMPALALYLLAGGMMRCSGNIYTPTAFSLLMCVLDILFNALLIFPTRQVAGIWIPGAGWGVTGAAVGTALALYATAALLLYRAAFCTPDLCLRRVALPFLLSGACFRKALRIGIPMMCERVVMCGAQILYTVIVAPLGTLAIAANSFAIIAESICYMPGYGVSDAAVTLVGHSLGARRKDLMWQFARITVGLGIGVMTVMGIVMYMAAPLMIGCMTPDARVVAMGVEVLRIEAFAEPLFAAAIVTYGVFVGAGSTVAPTLMNFCSIWLVRLPLAAFLAPWMGLCGAWVAMCSELCLRGTLFLLRLRSGKWLVLREADVKR